MSNVNVREFMEIAIRQNGYKESPPNSNKTKFGREFGLNGEPWCSIYEWWCGDEASDEFGGGNPIAHNASAAYIQEDTVAKGGKWIMRKTKSNATKKNGISKVKEGDIVDFDFGANDLYRRHTGLAIGRIGDYYITIEGNTSAEGQGGSQSNGGMVAIRRRKYNEVCSIVRPPFGKYKRYKPTEPFEETLPKLPKRGWFELGDRGRKVKKLQKALNWATNYGMPEDGKFGNFTLACVFRFQIDYGLDPDGEFGRKSMTKLEWLVEKFRVNEPVDTLVDEEEKVDDTGTEQGSTGSSEWDEPQEEHTAELVKLTKAEKLVAKAKECSWAYGTKKAKYAMPTGKPKKEYKVALDEAYPNRDSWGVRPRHGRSCDVFVGVCVRTSGLDEKWPRGLDEVMPYVRKHPKKWKIIKNPKPSEILPGDIIYQIYKSGAGHICIKMKGKNRVANAHYVKNTYPVIQAMSNIVKDAKDCREFYVIRRK